MDLKRKKTTENIKREKWKRSTTGPYARPPRVSPMGDWGVIRYIDISTGEHEYTASGVTNRARAHLPYQTRVLPRGAAQRHAKWAILGRGAQKWNGSKIPKSETVWNGFSGSFDRVREPTTHRQSCYHRVYPQTWVIKPEIQPGRSQNKTSNKAHSLQELLSQTQQDNTGNGRYSVFSMRFHKYEWSASIN